MEEEEEEDHAPGLASIGPMVGIRNDGTVGVRWSRPLDLADRYQMLDFISKSTQKYGARPRIREFSNSLMMDFQPGVVTDLDEMRAFANGLFRPDIPGGGIDDDLVMIKELPKYRGSEVLKQYGKKEYDS